LSISSAFVLQACSASGNLPERSSPAEARKAETAAFDSSAQLVKFRLDLVEDPKQVVTERQLIATCRAGANAEGKDCNGIVDRLGDRSRHGLDLEAAGCRPPRSPGHHR
jgi:hypothetical protein